MGEAVLPSSHPITPQNLLPLPTASEVRKMSIGGVATPRPFFCQRNKQVQTVKRYSYTSGLVGAFCSRFGVLSNALVEAEMK